MIRPGVATPSLHFQMIMVMMMMMMIMMQPHRMQPHLQNSTVGVLSYCFCFPHASFLLYFGLSSMSLQ